MCSNNNHYHRQVETMSRKKYDIKEVRQYAGSHNIIECADHYDVAVTSMYTWLNQHHVDYVHVIAKGERNINKRKLESDEIDILKAFDYDLQPLQSQPYWNSMYQQATRNADGKIPQKMFYDALMQSLAAADSAALLRLSAPTLRTSLAGPSARHLLSRLDTLRIFSHIASAKELREKAELLTRSLSYENNHFVDREEYFLQFPIPYFDADMARLLTSADLHFRLHTVDDMYSQLDSVWIEENVAPISQPITALTDTVMALAVHVKGDKAYDYQARLSRNEFRQIDLLLSQSAILSPAEYARMVKTGNLYFLRLASLPMRKQFKGLKIAFYAGSKAAVVVQDNHYCLMRCTGLKWLEEWVENQMK